MARSQGRGRLRVGGGRPWRGVPRILAAVVLLLPLVASCYVPDDFLVEIRVNRAGDFGLTYKGTLTWAPLWRDIRRGELTEAEIAEKVDNVRNDLVRYPGFGRVEHEGAGRFRVFYQTTGHVQGEESYYFLRSNARVFAIISRDDGLMVVRTPRPDRTEQGRYAGRRPGYARQDAGGYQSPGAATQRQRHAGSRQRLYVL